jgi:hypothetical protein
MKKGNIKTVLYTYGLIGTALCTLAGGIIGLTVSGPAIAILGAIIGLTSGQLVHRQLAL